jgi:hypothetical protein
MSTPDVRPVGDLPDAIGRTAARELSLNGITSLEKAAGRTEKELLAIHGVGPKAVRILGEALAAKGLTYRGSSPAASPSTRKQGNSTAKHRIYTTSFAGVYPHYVTKAERKGRTKAEVDEIIRWLTGYSQQQLETHLEKRTDFETFLTQAPRPNPARAAITGVICGVRVEDIEEPVMREIRYMDKLIDELAKGKKMEKILRQQDA